MFFNQVNHQKPYARILNKTKKNGNLNKNVCNLTCSLFFDLFIVYQWAEKSFYAFTKNFFLNLSDSGPVQA